MKPFLLLTTLLSVAFVARAQDAVFIVHPSQVEKTITGDDAKNILLNNKTKWTSGPVIRLVVLTDGAVHEEVVKQFTQRTSDQFDKYWKRQVFTGVGTMPTQAKNDAEVVAFVADNPGALGYVAKASVTSKVKVLETN